MKLQYVIEHNFFYSIATVALKSQVCALLENFAQAIVPTMDVD